MKNDSHNELARERILHVAADLFVSHGYKNTSVRKICSEACVNVSMVNYYFRSKDDLYTAVLDYARNLEIKGNVENELENAGSFRRQLRHAIELFLRNLLLPGTNSLLAKLIARETVESTDAIVEIVERDIRPQHEFLGRLVSGISEHRLTDEQIQKTVLSITGQALLYATNRTINQHIVPPVRYDDDGIREIAEHISAFTLGGIEYLSKNSTDIK